MGWRHPLQKQNSQILWPNASILDSNFLFQGGNAVHFSAGIFHFSGHGASLGFSNFCTHFADNGASVTVKLERLVGNNWKQHSKCARKLSRAKGSTGVNQIYDRMSKRQQDETIACTLIPTVWTSRNRLPSSLTLFVTCRLMSPTLLRAQWPSLLSRGAGCSRSVPSCGKAVLVEPRKWLLLLSDSRKSC